MASRTYRYFTGEPLEVDVEVRNTSGRDGDEVVQAYLVFPKLAGAPNLALRGFTRLHLKAGERRRVHSPSGTGTSAT